MSHKEQPWEQGVYETGRTRPPKSHVGLIAFLLAVVILLGGMTSALGILNIRLFAQLQEQQEPDAVAFLAEEAAAETAEAAGQRQESGRAASGELGITGEALDDFYQRYYRLPQGLWITEVQPDSGAEKAGIQPIDILLSLDGVPIADQQSLQSFLAGCRPGQKIQALIFRGGEEMNLTVTVGKDG